jgi:hypothetical protein
MMRSSGPSQNSEQPGLAFVSTASEQASRIAFAPARENPSTAPAHAAYFELMPVEKVMPLASKERQTPDVQEAGVALESAPPLPPSAVRELHSKLAPAGRAVWLLATVASAVAALVVSGFALISLLRVGPAPTLAGAVLKQEPVSSAATIAAPPPVLLAPARPASVGTTDPQTANLAAKIPDAPIKAKLAERRLASNALPVTGTLQLAVKPWGHVVVDGVTVGVTPPLKRLPLLQGQHKVQIENPGFATYLTRIEVRKDDAVTVTYEFK